MKRTILISAAALVLLAPATSSAVVITPNTTEDQFDTDPAHCSLREAAWTSDSGNSVPFKADGCPAGTVGMADTIQLPSGTYELDMPEDLPGDTNDVSRGDLDFSGMVTVEAAPGASATIDGNGHDRIFATFGGQALTIDGINVTGGFVDTPGTGSATNGGAIATAFDTSSVTVTDSAFFGNSADGGGGAIWSPGSISMANSTVSGNSSRESGGGGIMVTGNTLTLDATTVSANVGRADGAPMGSSTVAGGIAPFGASTITIHNSIVAGNSENSPTYDAPDCQGTIGTTGGNVVGSLGSGGTVCGFTPAASDTVSPAGLSPLAFRGGPTQTHGLLDSTAIDRGVATCQTLDQRGVSRAGLGASCDSGAFERGPDHTLTISPDPVNGTVTGDGIACPGDCTQAFLDGTNVPLTPDPSAGFAFGSWTNHCSGSGPCTAIMDADRTVGANFVALHTLAVTVTGPGTVTGTGIVCPGDCTEDYPEGTNVPLTQLPNANALFNNWTGDCTGSAACNVDMTSDRAVGAVFSALTPPAASPPITTGAAPISAPTRKCKKRKKRPSALATPKRCKRKKKK